MFSLAPQGKILRIYHVNPLIFLIKNVIQTPKSWKFSASGGKGYYLYPPSAVQNKNHIRKPPLVSDLGETRGAFLCGIALMSQIIVKVVLNRQISTSAFSRYQNVCQTSSIEKVTALQNHISNCLFWQNSSKPLPPSWNRWPAIVPRKYNKSNFPPKSIGTMDHLITKKKLSSSKTFVSATKWTKHNHNY